LTEERRMKTYHCQKQQRTKHHPREKTNPESHTIRNYRLSTTSHTWKKEIAHSLAFIFQRFCAFGSDRLVLNRYVSCTEALGAWQALCYNCLHSFFEKVRRPHSWRNCLLYKNTFGYPAPCILGRHRPRTRRVDCHTAQLLCAQVFLSLAD
jgi:hypothetical protein